MPLSDVLGISVGELLAGERFCREEAKEKTDQMLVTALGLTKRERAVLYGVCGLFLLICILLIAAPLLIKPSALEFVNNSQTSMHYDLGKACTISYGDFQKQPLRSGYVYNRSDGTARYAFLDTPEGPVMYYMHCSGEGQLFGFGIGEDTVIPANTALGLKKMSLRQYLEENGFQYDLMFQENPFGRPTLVYINGERCNWFPYTKDNVFINLCISAYEGNRLLAFDIGLLDGNTEQLCMELLSGFSLTLEDPYGLVTCELKETYHQWEQIILTAKRDTYKTLYVYINGEAMGKFNGPDPHHPEENLFTFEMWGAPVTVLVTPDSPGA